ncbi:hypothetical protein QF034_003379 [Streptomyces africanus]|uniref:Uncharacterized protein n=1 Tax=Streptomyces africanus TaxID=231024 RepID=A0ABU0QP46_9ACTN|nr:hypothetical protein [Streptomyces africanus]MDQ0749148.1 hypothetical protein [Streptomyces africanus]
MNLELPCATADQLDEAYRQARRAPAASTFPARDSTASRGVETVAGPLDRPR